MSRLRTWLPEAIDISGISNSELDVLFSTPDVYVRDIDWGTLDAVCARMSRDTYSASTFLDERTVSIDGEELRTPVVSLMDSYTAHPPTRRPIMFIAHTALCGSTLLSRCLDIPGACLPYRNGEHWLHGNNHSRFQNRINIFAKFQTSLAAVVM